MGRRVAFAVSVADRRADGHTNREANRDSDGKADGHADGRPDELIRGADIVGTPLASFAKILATSDKQEVFNGYCGAESGSVPVSAKLAVAGHDGESSER